MPERRRTLPERLSDGRVTVRCHRSDDVDARAAAVEASLPELRAWMPWAATEPISRAEAAELIERFITSWGEDHTVVICDARDEREVLGCSGLHPRIGPGGWEIGYWVRSDRTGAGIATAAARLLTTAAFEHLGADHVEIHHDAANLRSARVPRRLGFELVAIEEDEVEAEADSGVEWRWRTTSQGWAVTEPVWPPLPLETERLRLRAAREGDRPDLVDLWTSTEVWRYLGGSKSRAEAAAALPDVLGLRYGSFIVADRTDDRLLGAVAMSDDRGVPEISYQFLPNAWGRGLATEGVAAALHRAWAVDQIDEAIAVTQTANAPSIRLLARLGFEREDTFVEYDAEQVRYRVRLAGPTP